VSTLLKTPHKNITKQYLKYILSYFLLVKNNSKTRFFNILVEYLIVTTFISVMVSIGVL